MDGMIRGLNKVMLIGAVARDPEMRFTPAGRPVTTFCLGTPRCWTTSDGERRDETEWFTIVAWGNLAEVCKQQLARGQQVYVEGRLHTRRWDDQEGRKHTSTEVVASEIVALGDRHRAAETEMAPGENTPCAEGSEQP
jgi:single-strand DNA-binding protein